MIHDPMQRRSFLTLLGGAAAAWPLAARAQQMAMPVIGYVSPVARDLFSIGVRPFLQGLSEIGYAEGRNLLIDYRSTEGRNDVLPAALADLVRRQVAVIVAAGNPQTAAAQAATTTIPIVFLTGDDPVNLRFVASLSRPGGNLTGVTTLSLEVGPKRLELLRELLPTATSIALLTNPANPSATETQTKEMQVAAQTLGLQLHILPATSERDFDSVFASLPQLRAGALVILPDGFLISRSEQLAALALRHAIPAVFVNREFVAAGGLMSYGASTRESFRLVGNYTGRILKGEKPADLPVQQPTKVELIINMKTAKVLGVTFPTAILVRADEVIE